MPASGDHDNVTGDCVGEAGDVSVIVPLPQVRSASAVKLNVFERTFAHPGKSASTNQLIAPAGTMRVASVSSVSATRSDVPPFAAT